ncbi:hypothetical protein DFH09DRAFT_1112033 [Mycena vulgaris]|nr:hypothetical protein DFH09DRAFT_1112033 [Mycena vulgaris]
MPEKKLKYEKYYTLDEKDASWLPLCRDVRKALSKQAVGVLTSNTGYVPRSFVEYSRAGGAVVGPYPLAPNRLPNSNIMSRTWQRQWQFTMLCSSRFGSSKSYCHNAATSAYLNWDGNYLEAGVVGKTVDGVQHSGVPRDMPLQRPWQPAMLATSLPIPAPVPPRRSPIALRSTGSPTPPDQRVTRRFGVVDEEEDEDEFIVA